MPAKNIYHEGVVRALVADGWTVTHDPLTLSFGGKDLFVDLGAERTTIAAERGGQRIAVEIQSFLGTSSVRDLQEAVGQYEVYRTVLAETEPERLLYLAVPCLRRPALGAVRPVDPYTPAVARVGIRRAAGEG